MIKKNDKKMKKTRKIAIFHFFGFFFAPLEEKMIKKMIKNDKKNEK